MKEKDSDVRKRRQLTPEEKYQIFIESNGGRCYIMKLCQIFAYNFRVDLVCLVYRNGGRCYLLTLWQRLISHRGHRVTDEGNTFVC